LWWHEVVLGESLESGTRSVGTDLPQGKRWHSAVNFTISLPRHTDDRGMSHGKSLLEDVVYCWYTRIFAGFGPHEVSCGHGRWNCVRPRAPQFAGIAQVPFPSAYEKFLAFIGVFSLDLGWFLSAACLATGIGFFDKLL